MKKEITLPIELANGLYDLKELGTMFVLMCFPHMDYENREMWMKTETFLEEVKNLTNEGTVISFNVDGGFGVEIDLTSK